MADAPRATEVALRPIFGEYEWTDLEAGVRVRHWPMPESLPDWPANNFGRTLTFCDEALTRLLCATR